jgi:Ser/Thr protein kinase RdoA (MazF antagonist)
LLGRLHALPVGPAVLSRPGGAWHHLTDGSPRDEIAALARLVGSSPGAVSATLEEEVGRLDDGSGLPESFVHPDFVLRNVVAPASGGLVLVDWTGAGRAPRMWSLAFVLWSVGLGGDLRRVDRLLAGYCRHIVPEPAELERLEALIRVRPIVFDAWAVCTGRKTLGEATAGIAASREAAAAIAARARAFVARA